ncbi:hypothetical protein F4802DRAFT_596375 [Xylaria palmicola]|nr:hypothetical protein F4802DRAFT_596375 [Xylaria palmicola]
MTAVYARSSAGGEVAGKLHMGRRRNEEAACDMRVWLLDELRKIDGHPVTFLQVTAERAQRASPTSSSGQSIDDRFGPRHCRGLSTTTRSVELRSTRGGTGKCWRAGADQGPAGDA